MAGDSDSKSPKTTTTVAAPRPDAASDSKDQPEIVAKTEQPTVDAAKPLAPPPRPGATQKGNNTPDYFALQNPGGSLNQEPNPFEKSFGGDPTLATSAAPETPGGTKLPPVAAITSPSSLLPGTGTTPFNWGGGSLRTGPLSPAMLSAPQTDYFSDQFRGGFPTPNESSLRTGLTPGGSGSMFPASVPSPNTANMFNFGNAGGATPSTVDFHRTALRAAAADREHQAQQALPATSQPQQEITNGAPVKTEGKAGPFDNPDNDAANGLFMLAQGRNGVQQQSQYPVPPQPASHGHPAPAVQHPETHMNGNVSHGSGSLRGASEAGSVQSENSEEAARPNTRGKGKRNSGSGSASVNGRRKAEEAPGKAPANKKAKTNGTSINEADDMSDDDGQDDMGGDKPKHKMTEEEKRKNFLERNRVAALKCRQRKKQWLANLQGKVETYQAENEQLSQQVAMLREEVVNLKTLLLAHKDCPVTQQQGLQGSYMAGTMEPFNAQMNPYGMAAPLPNHQMIPAQGGQRRFS